MYDLLCEYFNADAVNWSCFLLMAVPFIAWRIAVAREGISVPGYLRICFQRLRTTGGILGVMAVLFFAYAEQKDQQKQTQKQSVIDLFTSISESVSNLRSYLTPEEKMSRLLPVGVNANDTTWVTEAGCVTSQVREAWQRVPVRRAAFRQMLPFPMPVGGNYYEEICISSTGVIGFDGPRGSELSRVMPYEEAADHVYLALLWGRNDFKPRLGSKMWCGVKEDGNFVASYDTVFVDGDTNSVAKVQVEFITNGDMLLRYKDLPQSATNAHCAGFQNLSGGWSIPPDSLQSNTSFYLKSFGPLDLTVEDSDTDGDGISDYYELYPTNNIPVTDPCNPDTDHDGLKDGWEVRHGFNPMQAAGTWDDPDSDGRPNVMESYMDTDPYVADAELSCLTPEEDKESVTFTLSGSIQDGEFAVLWFDDTALPFSVSNTSWTVYFPTGVLYEVNFEVPESYQAGLLLSGASRMFLHDPDGIISFDAQSSSSRALSMNRSMTMQQSIQGGGSFWMGYVDFSVSPVCSLVHRWDAHILFTADAESQLSSLSDGTFINWTATNGEPSSQMGWTTVFNPFWSDDESLVADVIAYSGSSEIPDTYVSSTGKVDLCHGHIDLSINAIPNFSPHLSETNTIEIVTAMHNCTHEVTPGVGCTFELELMRETTSGWQHVAWLDADPGTAGNQSAFTITNGWLGATILWDGIATESASQATSPDIFSEGVQPFNRIFPSVTSGKPLPPPFYTLFARIRKNDAVYAEASQTVYVPQVVKISWDASAVSLFKQDMYTDGSEPLIRIYHTTNTAAEAAIAGMPGQVQGLFSSEMNIRVTTNSVIGDYKNVLIVVGENIITNGYLKRPPRGELISANDYIQTATPKSECRVYISGQRDTLLNMYTRLATDPSINVGADAFDETALIWMMAKTTAHELGHSFGLVTPLLGGFKIHDAPPFNQMSIMKPGGIATPEGILGDAMWLPIQADYLTFILLNGGHL